MEVGVEFQSGSNEDGLLKTGSECQNNILSLKSLVRSFTATGMSVN